MVAERFIRQFLQLDFSRLGARQTASVKRSMGTPETFYGLPTRTDPKKVSLCPGRVRRLRRAVRGARRACGPEESQRSPIRSVVSFEER